MPPIVPRSIIKSWGEDTTNKDSPSQSAIGEGIGYAASITSSEPNGASFIAYEAIKYAQRTGGIYGATIPYAKGQHCRIVRSKVGRYAIEEYIFINATESTGNPPITGATVADSNGVDVYSGGLVDTTRWQLATALEGFDPAVPIYSDTYYAGRAEIGSDGRQYIQPLTGGSGGDPSINRSARTIAPTLEEILRAMEGLYSSSWSTQAADVATYPLRRLGRYIYNGAQVEAFGMFLSGQPFTDGGSTNLSKFYRSFDPSNTAQCVIGNLYMQSYLFSGTPGSTITPKDYRGRVEAIAGTPVGTGTKDARAALGAIQEDQGQIHLHPNGLAVLSTSATVLNGVRTIPSVAAFTSTTANSSISEALTNPPITDGTHGAYRGGYNNRECTFSVPVPMVISLLPLGQITL